MAEMVRPDRREGWKLEGAGPFGQQRVRKVGCLEWVCHSATSSRSAGRWRGPSALNPSRRLAATAVSSRRLGASSRVYRHIVAIARPRMNGAQASCAAMMAARTARRRADKGRTGDDFAYGLDSTAGFGEIAPAKRNPH